MKNNLLNWLPKVVTVLVFFGLAVFVGGDAVAENWQMFGLLFVGLLLGLFVSFFDRQWLSNYYQENKKNPTNLGANLEDSSPETNLLDNQSLPYATRTTLFLLILVPFSLFIVTSTGSPLGVGLTIGLVIDTVLDMVKSAHQKDEFVKTFLQQFQRSFSESEVLIVAGSAVIWLLLLFVLALK